MRNLIYAGIGSRETPVEVQQRMARMAMVLGKLGWTLRSGHAPGADQAFEYGAKQVQGKMEIYLPWDGFEGARVDNKSYFSGFISTDLEVKAIRIAADNHPNWSACSDGARKMHTRNVQQIGGRELNVAVDLVICWTKNGSGAGGTGQAIRIAQREKIPVFDLFKHTDMDVQNYINNGVLPA